VIIAHNYRKGKKDLERDAIDVRWKNIKNHKRTSEQAVAA